MGCGCNKKFAYDLEKAKILAQAFANDSKRNQIVYKKDSGYNFCAEGCIEALGKDVVVVIEPYRPKKKKSL